MSRTWAICRYGMQGMSSDRCGCVQLGMPRIGCRRRSRKSQNVGNMLYGMQGTSMMSGGAFSAGYVPALLGRSEPPKVSERGNMPYGMHDE
jgi:hypothetical protein